MEICHVVLSHGLALDFTASTAHGAQLQLWAGVVSLKSRLWEALRPPSLRQAGTHPSNALGWEQPRGRDA